MYNFKEKTAVVTGGASEIGLGLATELVNQGCNVAITDIHVKNGEAAATRHPPTRLFSIYLLTCKRRLGKRVLYN